jgi:hypothetical protein
MIAAPWYLLAVGILVVILGFFVAAPRRPPGSGGRWIVPRMTDKQITRNLQGGEGDPLATGIVVLGFVMVLVSVVWRIVLMLR